MKGRQREEKTNREPGRPILANTSEISWFQAILAAALRETSGTGAGESGSWTASVLSARMKRWEWGGAGWSGGERRGYLSIPGDSISRFAWESRHRHWNMFGRGLRHSCEILGAV